MTVREYESPCGRLLLGVHENKLCLCDWMVDGRIEKTLGRIEKHFQRETHKGDTALLNLAEMQLNEYFAGLRKEFSLPVEIFGTEFQRRVWKSLREIPFGETVSYKSVAESIGRISSVRAVANAIGANAISIIIPCHRVIGSNGSIGGYAGGLEAKRYLLDLENKYGSR